jgi:hypothetical protein
MKYDTLMPEYIEPYLNGRSWEDLNVGDEIAFPEKDDTITPESLVNRRITLRREYEGTIESFDPSTGKHEVAFDDGDKESYDFREDFKDKEVVIEGAEGYIGGPGVCIIRELNMLSLTPGHSPGSSSPTVLWYLGTGECAASRTRFVIPPFILSPLFAFLPQVLSTRSCSPKACSPWTSATATSQVRQS